MTLDWDRCEASILDMDGGLEPCDRPMVGIRQHEDGTWWPACDAHLNSQYLGDGRWTW